MIDLYTGSLPSELYPPRRDGRADTWAIKESMSQIMSEMDGLSYWNTLAKFLKGKLDRNEFESKITPILSSEKLISLHNALILSILYNATTSKSSNQSKGNSHTTGHGWFKRKRTSPSSPSPQPVVTTTTTATTSNPEAKETITNKNRPKNQEEKDVKKRKLKHAVLALGQRERNRIKEISSSYLPLNKNPSQSLLENQNLPQSSQQRQSNQPDLINLSRYLTHQRIPNVLKTPLASKMKISSSTLYQEYMRCQGALACSESRQLPDFDTLKDRMSLIAYDSGLINGVEKSASSLALIGLEVHLKTLLGDLLSLIRPDRSVSSNPIENSELNLANSDTKTADPENQHPMPSSSANIQTNSETAIDSSSSNKPTVVNLINQTSSNLRLRDLKTQGLAPHLTSRDVAALAEISPHAFVRTHPVALERLIATCSSSSSSISGSNHNHGSGPNLINSSEPFDRKPAPSSIQRAWPKPVIVEPRFGGS